MDCTDIIPIGSTERPLRFSSLGQQVNDTQPKGLLSRMFCCCSVRRRKDITPSYATLPDIQPIPGMSSPNRSHCETRIIANDSIVLSDKQTIVDFKQRQDRMIELLQNKGLKKVTINGEIRYGQRSKTFWSKVKSFFGYKSKRTEKCSLLLSQSGRDDNHKTQFNKNICEQQKGCNKFVTEHQLKPRSAIVSLVEEPKAMYRSKRDRIAYNSRQMTAALKFETLKNGFLDEVGFRQIISIEYLTESEIRQNKGRTEDKIAWNQLMARIDCEYLYRLEFGKRKMRANKDSRRAWSDSLRPSGHLLKLNNIKVERICGEGGMAYVFSAKCNKTQKRLAVKVPIRISIDFYRNEFMSEVQILKQLKHKNVIQLHDLCGQSKEPVMAMEFAQMDLYDGMSNFVRSTKKLPSLESARLLSLDIVQGLKYIHSLGYVHFDLKFQNILLAEDSSNANGTRAMISDFGFAHKDINRWNRYGTPYFAPPECIKPLMGDKDMRISDVWPIGIVIYGLITFHLPFPVFHNQWQKDPNRLKDRYQQLTSHKVDIHLPNTSCVNTDEWFEMSNLVRRLLEPRFEKRQSIQQISDDKWFENRVRSEGFYATRPFSDRTELAMF